MLFHLKDGYTWSPGSPIPSMAIDPVMFLSRCLTKAELSYRPSELEVAYLVWACKRRGQALVRGKIVQAPLVGLMANAVSLFQGKWLRDSLVIILCHEVSQEPGLNSSSTSSLREFSS
jgi:hypothetical protein